MTTYPAIIKTAKANERRISPNELEVIILPFDLRLFQAKPQKE